FAHLAFNELSQDLLEEILSWLPASSFFRLRSVCKRWSSVAASPTFSISCSHIPFRDPWFLMVDQDLDHSFILDTSEGNWKRLNRPSCFNQSNQASWIAVASSGGLVCFRSNMGEFMVSNLLTGACREIPPARETQPLLAVAVSSSHSNSFSYRIVLVAGELPNLPYRVFDSEQNQWEDEVMLARKPEGSPETDLAGDTVYFLNKSGDVVATSMQRNPSRQFSAVLSIKDGEEIVYFLSHLGLVVACNIAKNTFHEYPMLLPVSSEYSVDVVLCMKEMVVVLMSDLFETASLRLWRFSEAKRAWQQVIAMPPVMSHEFYGKKADINCVGCGDMIFVCLNSSEFSRCVIFNVGTNEWLELLKCL
ncbi:F-box only protein 13-like, partial [Phalaenopsis equestris]|uniref:F-box only protein 13-like n=1 Tax=Phalaenopsis equestris TaxID=78828 RepID=UPI0009E1D8FC